MMLMGPDDNYDDGVVIETMIFRIMADKFYAIFAACFKLFKPG